MWLAKWESEQLFILSNKDKLEIRKKDFSTSRHSPPNNQEGYLDKDCHKPYDLITRPNMVEYIK